ncbi:MAG: hypothetical protein ACTSX2_00440, partial [Candidatus Thorarchaeota archaeon]
MARGQSPTSTPSQLEDLLQADLEEVDGMGLLLLGLDSKGTIHVVNERFLKTLQLKRSDTVGYSFEDLISRILNGIDLDEIIQQLVTGKLDRYELV